jgi:hypothetical protein
LHADCTHTTLVRLFENVCRCVENCFFCFSISSGAGITDTILGTATGPRSESSSIFKEQNRTVGATAFEVLPMMHDRLRHPTRYRAAISRLARPCLDATRECLGFAVPSAGPSHAPVHAPVGCREACQTRLIIAAAVCFMPPLEQVFMTSALRRSASRRFSSKPMRRFAW